MNVRQFRKELMIAGDRPDAAKALDQVHMDLESLVRTHLFLEKYARKKDVVLIGDDDLMSLNFSRFFEPIRTLVLDIDQRVLDYLDEISSKYGLSMLAQPYNVLDELPAELRCSFDFFYTNPPYGSKNKGDSCKAFISRGIDSCRAGGYGAFVIGSSSEGEWARIAKERILDFVVKSGCIIVDSAENFQTYEGNPIKSSIFVVQKVKHSRIDNGFLRGIQLY